MKALYTALLKAQPLIDAAIKDKKNPHFGSRYADINSVIDACKKQLNDVGIVVLQPVVLLEQGAAVKTILVHAESGESIDSMVPLIGANDMQKFGSAVTYARRYGLQAMVLLGAEDDDGHKASTRDQEKTTTKPAPQFRAGEKYDNKNALQRQRFMEICKRESVAQDSYAPLAQACIGVPMANLHAAVQEWLAGPPAEALDS